MKRLLATGAICAGLTLLMTGQAFAQSTQLSASGPFADQEFGYSVSVSADDSIGLVGAPDAIQWSTPGAAFLFDNSSGTWTQTAELTETDGTDGDQFGESVALSSDGSTAVIGAPGVSVDGDSAAGAVFIYSNDDGAWTEVAEIDSPAPIVNGNFGASVAVSSDGSSIVVGAPTNGGHAQGGVYFYSDSSGSWTAAGSMLGSSNGALLGWIVTISGNGSAGAAGEPDYQYKNGTTTVYQPEVVTFALSGSTYGYAHTLSSPAGTGMDGFGQGALSMDDAGTSLLVGAGSIQTFNSQNVMGLAYVYPYSSGSWGAPTAITHTASTANCDCGLGTSGVISSDGTSVLLGAPSGSSTGTKGGGAAFQWTKSGGSWGSLTAYTGLDETSSDSFGNSVALASDSDPFIGDLRHSVDNLTWAGVAYAF